jgi:hypothetical protein
MPHPAIFTTLLLGSALLLACNSSVATSNSVPKATSQVTPTNKTLSVSRGETLSIVLPSAGAGGYQWHLVETYDARVVALKANRVGELPANSPPGKFADEIFDFQGLMAGDVSLTFLNYRSWEGPEQAVETRRYAVTVK